MSISRSSDVIRGNLSYQGQFLEAKMDKGSPFRQKCRSQLGRQGITVSPRSPLFLILILPPVLPPPRGPSRAWYDVARDQKEASTHHEVDLTKFVACNAPEHMSQPLSE